jgi:hypothetical protein
MTPKELAALKTKTRNQLRKLKLFPSGQKVHAATYFKALADAVVGTYFRNYLDKEDTLFVFNKQLFIEQGVNSSAVQAFLNNKVFENYGFTTKILSKDNINKAWDKLKPILQEDQNFTYDNKTKDYIIFTSSFGKLGRAITQFKKKVGNKLQTDKYSINGESETAVLGPNFNKHAELLAALVMIGSEAMPKKAGRLRKLSSKVGFHIGHAFGPGLQEIKETKEFVKSLDKEAVFGGSSRKQILKTLEDLIVKGTKIDANVTINSKYLSRPRLKALAEVKGKVVVTYFQAGLENSTTGSKLGNEISKDFKTLLSSISEDIAKVIKDDQVYIINNLLYSDPIFLKTEKLLVATFLGKKYKSQSTVKAKSSNTFKKKFKVKTAPVMQDSTFTVRETTAAGALTGKSSMVEVIATINENLHDYIKANMGRGNAPMSLNYRTGRFAKSAKVLDINTSRGKTAELFITYLRNPYDVFAPGGRLYNELRHPEKIIGRSIRQIMKDKLASQLSIRTRLV